MNLKMAIIPTMPSRKEYLKHTCNSIIAQVDILYVYLNNFIEIPEYLKDNSKVIFIGGRDYGSAGRFFMCDQWDGYYFMLDDDLIYPPTYVQDMIMKIEQYKRKAVITLHGRILKKPLENWFKDMEKIYACLATLHEDKEVHVGGTGAMAFHADTIDLNMEMFRHNNLDDVEFSINAQKQNVPIVCANHVEGYLKYQNPPHEDTIWHQTVLDQKPLVDLANSHEWKLFGINTFNGNILLNYRQITMEKTFELPMISKEEWIGKMTNLINRRKVQRQLNIKPSSIYNPVCDYNKHLSKLKIGKKVLDIGCGSMTIKQFLKPDVEYIGIDAFPINNDVVNMVIEECPFPDLYVDTIFCFAVLDGVWMVDVALQQMNRLAKNNICFLTGIGIEPDQFHTYKISENILNYYLLDFKQGFKEMITDKVMLVEYDRVI